MLINNIGNTVSAIALILTLSGCDYGDKPVTEFIPEKADYDVAFKRLEFQCIHERDHLPALHPDADKLYKYGLHLAQLTGPKDFDKVARYHRIAAAFDHYLAARNLQALLSQGMTNAKRPAHETINLTEHFMNQGVPGAYYDMGHYLELGYGVRQDTDAARYYFRRAADMGNPEAQYYVADSLSRIRGAGQVALTMLRCAMDQGHTEAALEYAIEKETREEYDEAAQAYQTAIKAGDPVSPMILRKSFIGGQSKDNSDYLAQPKDIERSRRYGLVEVFLDRYEHLGAKVPDIDQIVPLPPAKLPDWDETFEWKRKRDAAVPPSPPSEELIARMCEEKQLDPATGWPLSGLK